MKPSHPTARSIEYEVLKRGPSRLTVLLLLLLAAALLPILYAILVYAVDIPFQDEWNYVRLLKMSHDGVLTLPDLLKPDLEYIMLIPNLLFLALGYATRLNLKWEMALTLSMVAHTGWIWVGFLRRTASIPSWAVAGISFFFFTILFSASQYVNWVLGMQFVYFFPVYCLTACIFFSTSGIRLAHRSALVFSISFISTLSSPVGLLCWLSLLPLAWDAMMAVGVKRTWPWLVGGVSLSALSIAIYLSFYSQPTHLIPLWQKGQDAGTLLAFAVRLAGNGFGTCWNNPLTDFLGWMILTGFLLSCTNAISILPNGKSFGQVLPWFVLGLYGLGCLILITVGRANMGVNQACASRYTGYTLFLGLSVVILPVIAHHLSPGKARLRTTAWIMSALMITITAYKWARYREDIYRLKHFTSLIGLGKAGLLISRHIPVTEQDKLSYFESVKDTLTQKDELDSLMSLTSWLDSKQMIRPGLIEEPFLTESRIRKQVVNGLFSGFYLLRDTVFAKGRIEDPSLLPLRQAVVITSRDGSGRRRFVGIDNSGSPEWNAEFPKSRLNEADSLLEAWLLDGDTGKFRSIPGSHATPD